MPGDPRCRPVLAVHQPCGGQHREQLAPRRNAVPLRTRDAEVRSARVSADAALVAIVRIAAEPIVIAVSRVRIGRERGIEPIRRRRDRSLKGRRRERHASHGARGDDDDATRRSRSPRPWKRRGRAHRDHRASNAPHKTSFGPDIRFCRRATVDTSEFILISLAAA
jgi:hypothetical protein